MPDAPVGAVLCWPDSTVLEPLPIQPMPQADEQLSSWIARIAISNHTSVRSLLQWIGIGKLRGDHFDLTPAMDGLTRLAGVTGQRAEDLMHLALRPPGSTRSLPITGELKYRALEDFIGRPAPAWALSLAYCPECLRSDATPYFRAEWRLDYCTVCSRHHVELQQGCPSCGAAVTLHDHPGAVTLDCCAQCHAPLYQNEVPAARPEQLRFEQALLGLASRARGDALGAPLAPAAQVLDAVNHAVVLLSRCSPHVVGLSTVEPPAHSERLFGLTWRRRLLDLTRRLWPKWPEAYLTAVLQAEGDEWRGPPHLRARLLPAEVEAVTLPLDGHAALIPEEIDTILNAPWPWRLLRQIRPDAALPGAGLLCALSWWNRASPAAGWTCQGWDLSLDCRACLGPIDPGQSFVRRLAPHQWLILDLGGDALVLVEQRVGPSASRFKVGQ